MLIIEGVLPFLLPALWRDTFRKLTEMSDGQIRFIGLTSMVAGLLLLYIARQYSGIIHSNPDSLNP